MEPRLLLAVLPWVKWSTYLGDGACNSVVASSDSSASVYVAGQFPTDGVAGAAVSRIDLSGKLAWTRPLIDRISVTAIAADGKGVFVAGQDPRATFVSKLDKTGSVLWTAHLGLAPGATSANALAFDPLGNIYVAGATREADLARGGYDTTYAGTPDSGDGYVAKLNPDGQFLWSTFLGGDSVDIATGLACDAAGNVYATGWTYSSGWTTGGHDDIYDGESDAFVAAITADGAPLWSRYLGDSGTERANDIGIDATTGAIYVAGERLLDGSDNFEAFVTRLLPSGEITWDTRVGGPAFMTAQALVVNYQGDIYVGGSTPNFTDAVVAQVNRDGSTAWESLHGGAATDRLTDLAVDTGGKLFLVGTTSSSGWMRDGFDMQLGGPSNGFAVSLGLPGTPRLGTGPGDDVINIRAEGDKYITSVESGGWSSSYKVAVSSIRINAGAGNDLITVGPGVDVPVIVYGEDGHDTIIGGAAGSSLYGGAGDDEIIGGEGHDLLEGGEGNDSIRGGDGNDTLYGYEGDDLLTAGSGNDRLFGHDGADALWRGPGDDHAAGNDGDDTIAGGQGADTIRGNLGADILRGGSGNDSINGGLGTDLIDGGSGDDWISGGNGPDTILGADGHDSIEGNGKADSLSGGRGDDTLSGGAGSDTLTGDAGDDFLHAGPQALVRDELSGGTGRDRFTADPNDLLHDEDQLLLMHNPARHWTAERGFASLRWMRGA